MKQHGNHSLTTPLLALVECISLAHWGDNRHYRWCYQPIARARRAFHSPILESFFSRIMQTYVHLGGVNIEPAGISSAAANKMTFKGAAHDTIDWCIFDENLAWTCERLKALELLDTRDGRETTKRDLGEASAALKRVENEKLLKFDKSMDRMSNVLAFHLKVLEDREAIKEANETGMRMLELRDEMERIARGY